MGVVCAAPGQVVGDGVAVGSRVDPATAVSAVFRVVDILKLVC